MYCTGSSHILLTQVENKHCSELDLCNFLTCVSWPIFQITFHKLTTLVTSKLKMQKYHLLVFMISSRRSSLGEPIPRTETPTPVSSSRQATVSHITRSPANESWRLDFSLAISRVALFLLPIVLGLAIAYSPIGFSPKPSRLVPRHGEGGREHPVHTVCACT